MHYVDGFVAAVPTENKEKYIAHAAFVAPLGVWRHPAL